MSSGWYNVEIGLMSPFYGRVWLNVTALRDSTKTSAHKFAKIFHETLVEVRNLIDGAASSKM